MSEPSNPRREGPHPEVDFFNGLSGRLHIDFNIPDRELFDQTNPPDWKTVQLLRFEFEVEHYLPDEQRFCPITEEEQDLVV